MSDLRVEAHVNFSEMNDRVKVEIRRSITALTLRLQRTVQEDMLTGQRLNVQSGRLRGSISSKMEETSDQIEGTVGAGGSLVPYAPAHEFGLSGSLSVKSHVRQIKQAFGRPITPRESIVRAHTRNVHLPERRFMRDSLAQIAQIIPQNISDAIRRGLDE